MLTELSPIDEQAGDGPADPGLPELKAQALGPRFFGRWRYWARRRSVDQIAICCAVLVAATSQGSNFEQLAAAAAAGTIVTLSGHALVSRYCPGRKDTFPDRPDWGFRWTTGLAALFVLASIEGLWPGVPLAIVGALYGL